MREAHLLDLEELPTTEAAAVVIGQLYLEERYPTSTLPVEVRYVDPAGEPQTVEYSPLSG